MKYGQRKNLDYLLDDPDIKKLRKPTKEDFCFYLGIDENGFHDRAIKLSNIKIDLSQYHVAAVEQISHLYRLYEIGPSSKGVFRGDDMITCESITRDQELNNFRGLLIYNKDSYERAVREHNSYWTWMKNRNEDRWKNFNIVDFKNTMHCMRLLYSSESILLGNGPLVRFDSMKRDYLMKIRNAEISYEQIKFETEIYMDYLEELYKKSTIPDTVDHKAVENLYSELTGL